ncbi:MAG: hypothetical protein J0I33_13805 [Microbacterium ginsengisoli]|uniref:hypothetical protein n=1 Tax=Microbacterium TaxID=33882 RepID=UPI0006F87CC3|nr:MULTISPECIES: hypothetical protein [unclassified Microbacterium]KQR90997.1 hypothetical protein ASF93_08760 [Microbacterium sp. Leaf347]KQS00005.1 hypothetical protein ASG00_10960 [Microbacterium sp. Leaf351]MBN9199705.1 hypothetical protein [Microbacterium ginsengisoli]OJU75234.1 MAG: hypothetical protein BGO15_04195 [Microbacterium sp. 71-23]
MIGKQRAIPPDLWLDEDLIALPLAVKWTAIGLRMHADDEGRETTTDWMLRPSLWPGDPLSTDDLIEHLLLLDDLGYVGIYAAGGRTYYQVREWPAVSHPKRSRHPAPPPELFQRAAGDPLEDRSAWGGEGEGGEWGESGGSGSRPAGLPPSPFCRVHQPAGTGGAPCRHCGDARRAHDFFNQERRRG